MNVRAPEHYRMFDTAIGSCGVAWTERGLTRLTLPEADSTATEKRLQVLAGSASPEDSPPSIQQVIADVVRYLAGEKVDFASVALDLTGVSSFHRQIYEAARSVGWGQTASYGELARQAGCAGEAQAVGHALSRNPVAIIVPCHRIVAANTVGGFSAYGGAQTKKRLLALEGVFRQLEFSV
jgi:methylated-DNA-[protein]-cysteine S-methyltransferase